MRCERFAEVSLSDGLPVRFEAEDAQPLHFFLTDAILTRPPNNVEVYRLENGIAIYAKTFLLNDTTLSVITQKRTESLLLTVVKQGEISLGIESQNGFFNASLPPTFSSCELFSIGNCILLQSPTHVAAFTSFGRLLFLEAYENLLLDDEGITMTIPLSDHYRRKAEVRYTLKDGNATRASYTLKQEAIFPEDDLVAYAFFESVRIGASFSDFLSDELAQNETSILGFLGAFIHVLPTDQPQECLLVYKKAERLFDVRRFRVTIERGKIVDILG